MKTIQQYLNESSKGNYCVMCRIKRNTPYATFLFANNIWANYNMEYDDMLDATMKKLISYNKIFAKFPEPHITPWQPGKNAYASSEYKGYELTISFVSFPFESGHVNITSDSAPIFKSLTATWSETEYERKNRLNSFEKSGFSDLCEKEGCGKFILK